MLKKFIIKRGKKINQSTEQKCSKKRLQKKFLDEYSMKDQAEEAGKKKKKKCQHTKPLFCEICPNTDIFLLVYDNERITLLTRPKTSGLLRLLIRLDTFKQRKSRVRKEKSATDYWSSKSTVKTEAGKTHKRVSSSRHISQKVFSSYFVLIFPKIFFFLSKDTLFLSVAQKVTLSTRFMAFFRFYSIHKVQGHKSTFSCHNWK